MFKEGHHDCGGEKKFTSANSRAVALGSWGGFSQTHWVGDLEIKTSEKHCSSETTEDETGQLYRSEMDQKWMSSNTWC